jgi:hypothetical protein
MLKVRNISSSATFPRAWITVKRGGTGHRPRLMRPASVGQDPHQVPGDAAPGDVSDPVKLDVLPQRKHGSRVRPVRPEQRITERLG